MEFMETRVRVETVFLHFNTAPDHINEQFKVTPLGSTERSRSTEATRVGKIHSSGLEADSFFSFFL